MDENLLYLTGICPHCGATLDYREDWRAVVCCACGVAVPTSRLELCPPGGVKSAKNNELDKTVADGSASSAADALAYMGNVFESYDWASFAENDRLSIPLLDAIAENCKIRFSTDPVTYVVDFRRIAVPVHKKIDGLDVLKCEILDKYRADDLSDIFEYFDTYSAITKAIVAKRDELYKLLLDDIKNAAKFGLDKEIVKDLENSLELFKSKCGEITVITDISDIDTYRQAKNAKDEVIAAQLRERSIDAEGTYARAMEYMNEGKIDEALHLMVAIRGYRDSVDIIKEHSRSFTFNDEFLETAGKRYLLVKREITDFDVKNPLALDKSVLGSLYEIIDGVPLFVPALTQISKIIGTFGTRIFFVRNNEKICVFDTTSDELYANVRELDSVMHGDYVIDEYHPVRFSTDRTKFFICKKLRDEIKRGCFGRKKKVKNGINRQNNYAVVLVDMHDTTVRTILPAIIDVMDYFGDKLFYTTISNETGMASFRVCNLEDGTNEAILNADCVINDVCDGKIIFSTWTPSRYNMNIYSIDMATKETFLIDTNIRDFYATYGGKVFYTIGSDDYNRLYSANYDGTDRMEIMENAGRICVLRSGWIYYINGGGRNACLMKISTTGEKNQLIASRFDRMVKMTNGYIYYISTSDELRVVRSDGNCDRKITDSIANEKVIIDDEHVYCLRYEYVGTEDGDADGMSYSLYSMDLEGKNLRKLIFGATSMKEYDEGTIYVCNKKLASYMITNPVGKRGNEVNIVTKEITSYCSLDKATSKVDTIVTLGVPTPTSITYKSGCFRRKHERTATIVEIPRVATQEETVVAESMEIKSGCFGRKKYSVGIIPALPAASRGYTREGVSAAGAVLSEEYATEAARRQAVIDAKNKKKTEKREMKQAKREYRAAYPDRARAKAEEVAGERAAIEEAKNNKKK